MRSILAALALTFTLGPLAASAASAAGPCRDGGTKCARAEIVIFGEDLYEGIIKTPTGSRFETQQRAKFGRLLVLKKDLVLNIYATRHNRVLK